MSMDKIQPLQEVEKRVRSCQDSGGTVVFVNGCFDLLHVGHVRYLEAARRLGDLLVLGLNGDRSVRALKGKGRPILSQDERAEILAALESVDFVVLFDHPTVDPLLRVLKPDIHAKGTDYTELSVPERETVLSYGGRVAIAGDPKDHSTRELLARIQRLEDVQ